MKIGLLFNKHAWWIGVHYAPYYKRFCINLVPTITFWITLEGGTIPRSYK